MKLQVFVMAEDRLNHGPNLAPRRRLILAPKGVLHRHQGQEIAIAKGSGNGRERENGSGIGNGKGLAGKNNGSWSARRQDSAKEEGTRTRIVILKRSGRRSESAVVLMQTAQTATDKGQLDGSQSTEIGETLLRVTMTSTRQMSGQSWVQQPTLPFGAAIVNDAVLELPTLSQLSVRLRAVPTPHACQLAAMHRPMGDSSQLVLLHWLRPKVHKRNSLSCRAHPPKPYLSRGLPRQPNPTEKSVGPRTAGGQNPPHPPPHHLKVVPESQRETDQEDPGLAHTLRTLFTIPPALCRISPILRPSHAHRHSPCLFPCRSRCRHALQSL